MAIVRTAVINTETKTVDNIVMLDNSIIYVELPDDCGLVNPGDPYNPDNFPPAHVEPPDDPT